MRLIFLIASINLIFFGFQILMNLLMWFLMGQALSGSGEPVLQFLERVL